MAPGIFPSRPTLTDSRLPVNRDCPAAYGMSKAIFRAWFNSTSFRPEREPTNCVRSALRRLTRLSHMIQLECLRPSSGPTATWVESPCPFVNTGAQMTVENLESISTCRLTRTKTRCCLGSPLVYGHGKARHASHSPPNQSSGDWYSITSAASALSCSAAWLRRSRSRACACARPCSRRKRRSTRSITAERECFDPANLSMDINTSLESVTEVFSFILLLYYRRRRSGSPNHNPPKKTSNRIVSVIGRSSDLLTILITT